MCRAVLSYLLLATGGHLISSAELEKWNRGGPRPQAPLSRQDLLEVERQQQQSIFLPFSSAEVRQQRRVELLREEQRRQKSRLIPSPVDGRRPTLRRHLAGQPLAVLPNDANVAPPVMVMRDRLQLPRHSRIAAADHVRLLPSTGTANGNNVPRRCADVKTVAEAANCIGNPSDWAKVVGNEGKGDEQGQSSLGHHESVDTVEEARAKISSPSDWAKMVQGEN